MARKVTTKEGTRYEVRGRFAGKAYKRRFEDKWEAQDFETMVGRGISPEQAEALIKGYVKADESKVGGLSFRAFVIEKFLPAMAMGHASASERPCQRGTIHRAKNQLKIAFPFIGDRPIQELRFKDFREVKDALQFQPLKNGEPYMPQGANKTLGLMKQVLSFAVKEEYLTANPWSDAKLIRVPKTDKPFWRVEDCLKFLEAVKAEREDHFVFFLIALQGGLRRSELFGLRKMDVDLEDRTIRVCRQWDTDAYEFPEDGIRRIEYKSSLKMGRPSKIIPMTETVFTVLSHYVSTLIRPETPLYTFPINEMKQPRLLITHYVKKAGVADLKMHSTRDSFIGNMKKAGVSDFHIARIAGCNVRNLEKYGHLSLKDVAESVSAIAMPKLLEN